MKINRQIKYSLLSLIIASAYWFADSSVHHFLYKEADFEVFPSEINELWMRMLIIVLVVGFGVYVDISVKRMRHLFKEKYLLQLKLDQALTKLLSGYLPICSVCKKVKVREESIDKNGGWENIEFFISKHSEMKFTHGYCPECYEKTKQEIQNLSK